MFHPWIRTLIRKQPKLVQPIPNWKIVAGDKVEIIKGKDKGKQGKVKSVARNRNLLVVENLNLHRRFINSKDAKEHKGMYVKETPIHYSKVSLVDPKTNKKTKVKMVVDPSGEKLRISKASGSPIPKPVRKREDLPSREAYKEQDKDTKADAVSSVTYTPSLLTFEEEIIRALGLEDNATVMERLLRQARERKEAKEKLKADELKKKDKKEAKDGEQLNLAALAEVSNTSSDKRSSSLRQ